MEKSVGMPSTGWGPGLNKRLGWAQCPSLPASCGATTGCLVVLPLKSSGHDEVSNHHLIPSPDINLPALSGLRQEFCHSSKVSDTTLPWHWH